MTQRREDRDLIPHEVVSATVDGATPLRAWREYLGLTQVEVANRSTLADDARDERLPAFVRFRATGAAKAWEVWRLIRHQSLESLVFLFQLPQSPCF